MKNTLVSKELCVGKRKVSDTTKDGSAECSIMSTDKYMFFRHRKHKRIKGI